MLEDLLTKTKIILLTGIMFSYGCATSNNCYPLLDFARKDLPVQQYCNNHTVDDFGCIEFPLYCPEPKKTK